MAEEDGDEDEAVVVHAEEHSGCEQLEVDREGDSKQRKARRGTKVTEEVAATVHTGQTDRLTDCSGAASSSSPHQRSNALHPTRETLTPRTQPQTARRTGDS